MKPWHLLLGGFALTFTAVLAALVLHRGDPPQPAGARGPADIIAGARKQAAERRTRERQEAALAIERALQADAGP